MCKRGLMAFLLVLMLLSQTAISWADQTIYVEPESNDIQMKDAIKMAKTTLCDHFEALESILDSSSAEASFGYLDGNNLNEPIWVIAFNNPDAYYGTYYVTISRSGQLISYQAPYVKEYGPDDNELTGTTTATPSQYDITEQQAVETAKDGLNEIGDFETRMDQLTTKAFFLCGDRYNNGNEPVWIIYFYQGDELQQKVLLGYDGTYICSVPAGKQFDRTSRPDEGLGERFNFNFADMSVEEKAAFSKKWIPIVEAYIKMHPYYPARNDLFYQATRQVFGVPREDSISQEKATSIAKQAVIALGANASTIENRKIGYSFDITDPDRPLWVLALYSAQMDELEETLKSENSGVYEVVINGKTGSVIKAHNTIGETETDGFYY